MIICAKERKEKNRSLQVSLSFFSLVSGLLFDYSRVLEYAKIRTVLQSISVSICEIEYTVSLETIHEFQQIRCRGANDHHYCEGNE